MTKGIVVLVWFLLICEGSGGFRRASESLRELRLVWEGLGGFEKDPSYTQNPAEGFSAEEFSAEEFSAEEFPAEEFPAEEFSEALPNSSK